MDIFVLSTSSGMFHFSCHSSAVLGAAEMAKRAPINLASVPRTALPKEPKKGALEEVHEKCGEGREAESRESLSLERTI